MTGETDMSCFSKFWMDLMGAKGVVENVKILFIFGQRTVFRGNSKLAFYGMVI